MIDTLLSGPPHPRSLPRARAEDGFTLIELLVGVALALTLFGATLGMLESSQRVQARDTDWALAMQEGRTGLARMAEEIRQAYTITSDTHNSIEFYATIGGKKEEIYYNCA
jgi:prepilin-type N-terminal cleavage/methylation domain-containing protein